MTEDHTPEPQTAAGPARGADADDRRPVRRADGHPARPARRAAAHHRAGLPAGSTSTCAATRSRSPVRAARSRCVERLVDELLAVIATGQPLTADAVERSVGMLRAADQRAPGRRADPEHPLQPRPHDPAEDAEPEALRRRDRRAHHRLRDRPGRHRQDLPGDGQGRAGAAGQAGQPDHPDPAGGRGRRAARLPARHAHREDRPLPAPAVRRAARHDRPRVDPAADGGRARSRWPRWPTCAAARSTTRSSSSTRRRTPRPSR